MNLFLIVALVLLGSACKPRTESASAVKSEEEKASELDGLLTKLEAEATTLRQKIQNLFHEEGVWLVDEDEKVAVRNGMTELATRLEGILNDPAASAEMQASAERAAIVLTAMIQIADTTTFTDAEWEKIHKTLLKFTGRQAPAAAAAVVAKPVPTPVAVSTPAAAPATINELQGVFSTKSGNWFQAFGNGRFRFHFFTWDPGETADSAQVVDRSSVRLTAKSGSWFQFKMINPTEVQLTWYRDATRLTMTRVGAIPSLDAPRIQDVVGTFSATTGTYVRFLGGGQYQWHFRDWAANDVLTNPRIIDEHTIRFVDTEGHWYQIQLITPSVVRYTWSFDGQDGTLARKP